MKNNSRLAEMAVPLMVVGIVVVMILPLPSALLDLLLAASIATSAAGRRSHGRAGGAGRCAAPSR